MKVSAVVIAVLLVTLALSFSLVRMDIVDAALLRFLPALVAIIIAGGIAYSAFLGRAKKPIPRAKK